MKISMKWLQDYVDAKLTAAELSTKLTSAGIEVDAVEDRAGDFNHVVVGHIKEFGKHPNADRLTLCQVDVGDGKLRQIVCGAKNHKLGDKVVAALVGAVLPGNFEIKQSKIRDVESQGMLCSDKELGLSSEGEGIRILPADAPVGKPFADYMGFDDVVLELSVSPNRADCLSHFGLAREVAALTGSALKKPEAKVKAGSASTKKTIQLEVKEAVLCPRYSGLFIAGVKVGPSPGWLKQRIESVGLKSINNIVDVTNFVMMELGQPMHAFDADQIAGAKIIVEKAKAGEKFKTFDGTELTLTGEELTIRDGSKAVALAGVIGGLNSGVTDATKNIFLESAHFAAESVRRSSRKHGVETDSGYRFSRGTDPEVVILALMRAAELIQQVAGGEVAGDHHDFYPTPYKQKNIAVRKSYVEDRLGYAIDTKKFEEWMKRLGCDVKTSGSDWTITPPAFRVDLNQEVDFVEEFARLNGFEHIPENFPSLSYEPAQHDARYTTEQRLRGILKGEGFAQAVNYGFISSKWQKTILGDVKRLSSLGVPATEQPIAIRNPLNEELDVMRVSLVPGLLKNAIDNIRYGQMSGRQFELGSVFFKEGEEYKEALRIGLVAFGQREEVWVKSQSRPVVYDLKEAVENLLKKLMIYGASVKKIEKNTPEFLHPGQCVSIFVEGRNIGYFGTLHPSLKEQFKLREDVAVGEIDVEKLMRGQPRLPKLKKISKLPSVERDLAFLLPKTMAAADVIQVLEKAGQPYVQSVEVFDVFEGKSVAEDSRSVAFRMIYQNDAQTFTEEDLTKLQNQSIEAVKQKLGVSVR